MISQRLVNMIEAHADELTRRWLKEVRQNRATAGYHSMPDATLCQRAFEVYAHLGRWVGSEERREEKGMHTHAGDATRPPAWRQARG